LTTKRFWRIWINLDPVGKGRPRAVRRGNFVSVYTPKKTKDFELAIADAVSLVFAGTDVLECALRVCVYAVFRRPKSMSRKKDIDGRPHKTTKPDADNILKAVLDGVVLSGAITDDAIVADARCVKKYNAKGCAGLVGIEIERLELPDH